MHKMRISDCICSAALDAHEMATNIQKKGWWNRVFNSVKHRADLASVEQLLENEEKKFEVRHFFVPKSYAIILQLLIILHSCAPSYSFYCLAVEKKSVRGGTNS